METLFDELKRYVQFDDEADLRALHPILASQLVRIGDVVSLRLLRREGARMEHEAGGPGVDRTIRKRLLAPLISAPQAGHQGARLAITLPISGPQ